GFRNSRQPGTIGVRRESPLPSKSGLLRGFSHSGKPKSTKAISIPDPNRHHTAIPADTRNHELALSDQRIANLPMKAPWDLPSGPVAGPAPRRPGISLPRRPLAPARKLYRGRLRLRSFEPTRLLEPPGLPHQPVRHSAKIPPPIG